MSNLIVKSRKAEKVMACALACTLALTVYSSNLTVKAADTASPATSSQGTTTGNPPSGSKPSGNPPSGSKPSGSMPSGGGAGGANTMTFDYTGAFSGALSADASSVTSGNKSYTATSKDQNAALVQKAGTLKITNDKFTKSGDDTNGDNCNFYGLNSILLAVSSGSTAYISGSTLSASSQGSNGIFATNKAKIFSNNNTITTTSDNSRGLDATYAGTILANLMKISTKGNHSASIATDRGGGYISVTNSTLSTAGSGSPLLYSTGDIEVNNVKGTSTHSQIAGMEGLNKISIYNSTLTSTNTKATASDPIMDGIIIYQSTSGDAETTTGSAATFEVSNSTLTSAITSGAMFYSTNTKANIVLNNTTLDFDSSNVNLMTIQGNNSNSWGTAGSNGATVKFSGIGETLKGKIDVDTISSLDMFLLKNTTYTGATAISKNTVNTSSTKSPISMNLDGTSKWIVTGNSTVTNLNAETGATIVDQSGKTVSIIVNGKTVVNGTSAYKITVTGKYSTSVTTDSTNALSTSLISRTAFDKYYGVSTSYGASGSSVSSGSVTNASTANNASSSVEKQDNNHIMLYVIIIAIIIIVGAFIIWYRRRKKKK